MTQQNVHKIANKMGIKWDGDKNFISWCKQTVGKGHLDDMSDVELTMIYNRIKNGKSKTTVEAIRSEIDINKRDGLKKNLPAVIWSGTFKGARKDAHIDAYSHLIVLDIDKCGTEEKARVMQDKYVFAAWISPSGNGVKALVKVETSRHRDHFRALKRRFPLIDPSGVNPSRLCFESYDADLYLNEASEVFKDVIAVIVMFFLELRFTP